MRTIYAAQIIGTRKGHFGESSQAQEGEVDKNSSLSKRLLQYTSNLLLYFIAEAWSAFYHDYHWVCCT
jgi:hypothetical protein